MTPGELRHEIVAERSAWVREMLAQLRALPLGSFEEFAADSRNPAAAESFLRRALEALLDLGRHVLAKGFGRATTEYKEIARALGEVELLDEDATRKLTEMAGFRNRLVHFYDQVGPQELFEISTKDAKDIDAVLDAMLAWVEAHSTKAPSDSETEPPGR